MVVILHQLCGARNVDVLYAVAAAVHVNGEEEFLHEVVALELHQHREEGQQDVVLAVHVPLVVDSLPLLQQLQPLHEDGQLERSDGEEYAIVLLKPPFSHGYLLLVHYDRICCFGSSFSLSIFLHFLFAI